MQAAASGSSWEGAAKKPKAYAWAASKYNKRDGESEKDQSARILSGLGDVYDREERLRDRDDGLRRAVNAARFEEGPHAH